MDFGSSLNAASRNAVSEFWNNNIDKITCDFYGGPMCKIVTHSSVYYYGPLT